MSNITLDILDKVLIKCMDFSELLTTEDLKMEDLKKSENLAKGIRKDIFTDLLYMTQ